MKFERYIRQRSRDKRTVRQEAANQARADADYKSAMAEKEERQKKNAASGLGLYIGSNEDYISEDEARRKKAQGLGAAISGGISTLG